MMFIYNRTTNGQDKTWWYQREIKDCLCRSSFTFSICESSLTSLSLVIFIFTFLVFSSLPRVKDLCP
jgi:hypothetical protein